MSKLTTPSVCERPVTSARATGFGRYSSLRIASSTRCRVAARTCGLSLITRETVCSDTPASFATSAMTTARGLGVLFASELMDSVDIVAGWPVADRRRRRGRMLALTAKRSSPHTGLTAGP